MLRCCCWLQGADGDALHAVLCAAGFNIRWLLRAIATKGLKGLLLALWQWALWPRWIASASHIASIARAPPSSSITSRPHHALAVLCGAQR